MKDETNKIISWIEMGYTRLNYKEELLLVNYIKQLQQENKKYKEVIDKAIEYINKFEDIKAYYSYEENGYEEYNYEEDFKNDLLEILKEVK